MKKQRVKLTFIEKMIQGAVGKKYVIKHYRYGAIKTKYPDMTRIIASPKQRTCRNLFREAVVYAKSVIADPVMEAAWQKRLRRPKGVYNEAVKAYMLKDKRAKEREDLLTRQLIRNAFRNTPGVGEPFVIDQPGEVPKPRSINRPQKTNKFQATAPG